MASEVAEAPEGRSNASPAQGDDAVASSDADVERLVRRLRRGWWTRGPPPSYRFTREAYLRAIGFIYFVAFFSLARQLRPLIGEDGLLPAAGYLDGVRRASDSAWDALLSRPTLFWADASDGFMLALCTVGLAGSLALLAGFANVPLLATLWLVYLSFVHIGQVFYGYGWELMLLEAGFLGMFLAPGWQPRLRDCRSPSSPIVIGLLRWLLFRVMFGAGLIKLRGDPCWAELTCLEYHYETQPVPNPLSWYLHQLPGWFHALGVGFNHFVELVVPWGVFGPRRVRHVAGALIAGFQAMLIVSGNLSFLNWLTLAVGIACFDDSLLARLTPRRLRERAATGAADEVEPGRARKASIWALAVLVAVLSVNPVVNMISRRQLMNASFDPLHLVNTYGAFGSINRVRYEVVIEGTHDEAPGPETEWREYELPCKPGRPDRPPCIITPYHYRLDWQMWFAALRNYEQEPWIVHLVYKLLRGDETALQLFVHNPFPDAPPTHVRATLYRYELTSWDEDGDAWWKRAPERPYIFPLSLDDPRLEAFLEHHGWK